MLGVFVNIGAVVIGGIIGLFLKKGLSDKIKKVVMQAIGLSTIVIGISSAILTESMLLLIMSLVIGGIIGSLLKIEDNLDKLGLTIEEKFSSEGGFAKGFVFATLLYCVGAMTIVGSLEAGISGDNTTLFIKSILDGTTAIILTATLGYGVIFSSVSILVIQGGLVLLSGLVEPFLTEALITEISAVGGVCILGIGFNLLEIKKIYVGDLLPALIIPVIWFMIQGLI